MSVFFAKSLLFVEYCCTTWHDSFRMFTYLWCI